MERHSHRSMLQGLPPLLVLAVFATGSGGAAAAGVAQPRNVAVALRANVAADGHVASSRPTDPQSPLNGVAQQLASKLVLAPARKDGRAVASTTCLTLGIAAEPRPDGSFGVKLKRVISGPCVASVGKSRPPPVSPSQGGLVVVGANLLADGSVDPATITTERAEVRHPSSVDQARYTKAAVQMLRQTRFELDTVAGSPVTAHVSAPFLFNGGPAKRKGGDGGGAGEDGDYGHASMVGGRDAAPADLVLPSLNATSTVAGMELPKIDYTAP